MALNRSLRLAALAGESNANSELIAQLYDEIKRLVIRYQTDSPHALLPEFADLQEIVFRLIEGRQSPRFTRDLYVLAALVTGMLAETCEDMGDLNSAIMHVRTACMCADRAELNALQVWARAQQALFHYWSGALHDAIRYSRFGAEFATGVRGTAAVRLAAGEARIWAALGNTEASRDALERAQQAEQGLVPDDLDLIGGHLVFTRPRRLYWAADTSLLIHGDSDFAEQQATAAVEAYTAATPEEYSYNNEQISRADLALARARRADMDGTVEAMRPVLEVPAGKRSNALRTISLRVRDATLVPRYAGSSTANALQEEIEFVFGTPPRITGPPVS
jgi:hypothetical protein